jgi:VanZ family protein
LASIRCKFSKERILALKGVVWNWAPVLGYMVLIFIFSSFSFSYAPKVITSQDKIAHLIEYAILALLLSRSLINTFSQVSSKKLLLWVITLATIYGLFDEFHQSFVLNRDASIYDVLADFNGSIIGGIGFVWWRKFFVKAH